MAEDWRDEEVRMREEAQAHAGEIVEGSGTRRSSGRLPPRNNGREVRMPEGKEDKKEKIDFVSPHIYDEWTYEVDGDTYVIKNGGTKVPAGKADKLIAASRKTEARLRKV